MLTKTSVIENGRLNEFGLKGKKNPFRKKELVELESLSRKIVWIGPREQWSKVIFNLMERLRRRQQNQR